MDPQEMKTLQLLDEIERDANATQRSLAVKLDVSLGLVNSFIKRLVHKGYVKVTTIPKNRIRYILTPVGAAEKTHLTYAYIQHSYQFYRNARSALKRLFQDFKATGVNRIVLAGVNDFAEIACLSAQEADVEIVAVVDERRTGECFMQLKILSPERLMLVPYDRIVITGLDAVDAIEARLSDLKVPPEKIVTMDHVVFPIGH